MKYLGIDYGSKRTGIAISDDAGGFAFPLQVAPTEGLIARIRTLCESRGVGVVVVGDARSFGGGENPITAEADAFAEALRASGLRVERVWEAGSSVEASRFAPGSEQHNDAAAAAILLQRFLDSLAK